MKYILSLLLIATALTSKSQTADDTLAMYKAQVDTMTVVFTAPVGTECYVARYVDDPSIILQVAFATEGIVFTDSVLTDDDITATISIKGKTVIKCFQVLKNMPEGYCADENKKLLTSLMPSIMASPALAYVVGKLRSDNAATVLRVKQAGAAKVAELQKLLN